MFRRTFMALAGGVSLLGATQTTTAKTTTKSNRYDIHPGDSDATIQGTLDDGGLVRAAPGDYQYNRDLELPNGTTLRGAGERQTVFHADGPHTFVGASGPARNITVEGLTIDGHDHGANGVKLWGCEDVTVRDVTVRNCGTRDAQSNAGGIHARVDSNDDAGDILLDGVTAVNCSAVSLDCGGDAYDAGPVTVRDCEVRDPNRSNRFTHGISVESTTDSRVVGCQVHQGDGAQLAINVNACAETTVADCRVTGWKNGVHNYNARERADVTVRDCRFRGLAGIGVKIQPAGDDSYGNAVVDCRFDGCKLAIQGKHGGAVDIRDCTVRNARKAVKMNDITTHITVRGVDVRDGQQVDERTVSIRGDRSLTETYGQITDCHIGPDAGYIVVGMPATIASNTVLGTWNSEPGRGGSLNAANVSGSHIYGNTLGGSLKYTDGCVTRDNETQVL